MAVCVARPTRRPRPRRPRGAGPAARGARPPAPPCPPGCRCSPRRWPSPGCCRMSARAPRCATWPTRTRRRQAVAGLDRVADHLRRHALPAHGASTPWSPCRHRARGRDDRRRALAAVRQPHLGASPPTSRVIGQRLAHLALAPARRPRRPRPRPRGQPRDGAPLAVRPPTPPSPRCSTATTLATGLAASGTPHGSPPPAARACAPGGPPRSTSRTLSGLPARRARPPTTTGPDRGRRAPTSRRGCGSGCDGHAPRLRPARPATVGGRRRATTPRRSADRVAIEFREHQPTRGTMPGEWARWVSSILEPVVPWQQVLAAAVRRGIGWAHGHTDYTYTRISRRQRRRRTVILPALRRPCPRSPSWSTPPAASTTACSPRPSARSTACWRRSASPTARHRRWPSTPPSRPSTRVRVRPRCHDSAVAAAPTWASASRRRSAAAAARPHHRAHRRLHPLAAPPPRPVIAALLGRQRADLPPTPEWAQRVECVPG